jgi:hypothetical protein
LVVAGSIHNVIVRDRTCDRGRRIQSGHVVPDLSNRDRGMIFAWPETDRWSYRRCLRTNEPLTLRVEPGSIRSENGRPRASGNPAAQNAAEISVDFAGSGTFTIFVVVRYARALKQRRTAFSLDRARPGFHRTGSA